MREEGFAVDTAPTTLLISSRHLPDGSGLELLAEWRRDGFTAPILVLTAKDLLADKVGGLKAGADDYLTKPFSFDELLARIQVLLRRRAAPPQNVLEMGDLRLDRTGRHVERAGRAIELTAKEFALLEYFALHPGQVLSRATIAEHVWDQGYDAQSNVIDVIVSRLRRKLEADGAGRLIHTVGGVGYTLRRDSP